MQAQERLPISDSRTRTWRLADYVGNAAIVLEVESLLAGRTRDIKLTGELRRAFRDRSWRQTAKIIRSWMVWVVVLDVLTLSMNMVLLPSAVARSMLAPGAIIPVAALAIYLAWGRRRSDWLLGGSLTAGMFVILLAVCMMGTAAGGLWQERYLYVMVFVGIAGITTFSISIRYTLGIASSCLFLYLAFQLQNPLVTSSEAISTFFFFACGVAAVVMARRTMDLLAKKGFLLELRDGARLLALTDANERLDRLAKIDPLTGLANRRWMSDLLCALADHPAGQRGHTSVLMCDIDHFKALNDRLGHAAGDRCLIEIATIIDRNVRSGADLVARYGGEEFLVILPETSAREALLVAEQIRSSVFAARLPNPGASVIPVVTVSIGVASRSQDQAWTPDEIQWEADRALYEAKEQGRNKVVLCSRTEPHHQPLVGALDR